MNDSICTRSHAPAVTLRLAGAVRVVDLGAKEVRYAGTDCVGATVTVTTTGLTQETLREFAKGAGDPLPAVVRFG